MSEILYAQPGDLLEYRCPNFGIVWQWRVHGVYLGASRQEGLIEVSPVMAQPGVRGDMTVPRVLVPEPMTRTLTIVRNGGPQP
jgi:hypothetical protein